MELEFRDGKRVVPDYIAALRDTVARHHPELAESLGAYDMVAKREAHAEHEG